MEAEMVNGTPSRNPIGRIVSRLRSERDWSQEHLAIRLQCAGVDVSRDMLARVELGITRVSVELLLGLQRVFRVPIVRLFPKQVQDMDTKFARRNNGQMYNPVFPGKSRKCQKLTKRRHRI